MSLEIMDEWINKIHCGDVLNLVKQMPDESVDCCVTSPPYFGLRDYGYDNQIGLESTPEKYVENLVEVFREVKRVLKPEGTLWLNLGDSYVGSGVNDGNKNPGISKARERGDIKQKSRPNTKVENLKSKDLIMIPARVALALQSDGWYLRQDIIWCLSGGTRVYAKTQKGEMPTTIKDLARLDPSTIKLWNGKKWTQLLGISKSSRQDDEIEIVLRSGERVSCTPTHKFPTERGLLKAKDIVVGDILDSCQLPEPEMVKDYAIDEDAAWFAGLYLAEGSRSGRNKIQIAGHVKETERWEKIKKVASKYGGSAKQTIDGNKMNIRVYGKILNAIIDEFISGKTAHDKCFAPAVWKYSNNFLAAMVDGYLDGDGSKQGDRWRLGFCRNYNLESSLRTACARLGYCLTLNMGNTPYNGDMNPIFRGELRKSISNHWNNKSRTEVVEIRKSRARQFYDIGVEDKPHIFALASGVLTHNSKPNPMPESVTDRCTKSHEYIFLLGKSQKYYFDSDAIKENSSTYENRPAGVVRNREYGYDSKENNNPEAYMKNIKGNMSERGVTRTTEGLNKKTKSEKTFKKRNKRSVWTVNIKPYKDAHFAVYPEKLIEPCIRAGSPENGVVLDPFMGSGTTAVVARKLNRNYIGLEINSEFIKLANKRINNLEKKIEEENKKEEILNKFFE